MKSLKKLVNYLKQSGELKEVYALIAMMVIVPSIVMLTKPNTLDHSNPFDLNQCEIVAKGEVVNEMYGPGNTTDHISNTAWALGKDNSSIVFQQEKPGFIRSISIINGLANDEKDYVMGNRVQTLRMIFDNGDSASVILKDMELGVQTIEFDVPVLSQSIEFEVVSVYEGEVAEYTYISELMVNETYPLEFALNDEITPLMPPDGWEPEDVDNND